MDTQTYNVGILFTSTFLVFIALLSFWIMTFCLSLIKASLKAKKDDVTIQLEAITDQNKAIQILQKIEYEAQFLRNDIETNSFDNRTKANSNTITMRIITLLTELKKLTK